MVVAYDEQRGIGANNGLLWGHDLPDDMQHFRTLTTGNTVVMGRKTYESIGKPLSHRRNIVVSSSAVDGDVETIAAPEQLDTLVTPDETVCIIGGGQLYRSMLDQTDIIYATEVLETFPQATVFFPELDDEWRETSREHRAADGRNLYDFDFVTYTKQR